jgi:hypothetical protein
MRSWTKPIVAESVRWGDYRRDVHQFSEAPYQLYTREGFYVPEITRMVTAYFPTRTTTVLGKLRIGSLYPSPFGADIWAIGGRVAFWLCAHDDRRQITIYYTTNGADPRVYGHGYFAIARPAIRQEQSSRLGSSVSSKPALSATIGVRWSKRRSRSRNAACRCASRRSCTTRCRTGASDAYEYIELQNVAPRRVT